MQPQLDLVLTWGDVVVAHKRVPFVATIEPREHFALPDEPTAHALTVVATRAERGSRPNRGPIDRAFGVALLAALVTHVGLGWIGASSPEDEGEALTGVRLAMVRAASIDHAAADEATEGTPQAAGVAAPLAYGLAVATPPTQTTADHDEADDEPTATFGMVGLLDAIEPRATSGFGVLPRADSKLSGDGMWSSDFGGAGVELSGIGEGGGGPGSGVSLTEIGGLTFVPGIGHPVRLSGHVSTIVCHLRMGEAVVGRLDATAIQRVIHQNEGRFRGCYQDGLVKNPALEGRVTVKFAIARDGSVIEAAEDTEDGALPDAEVRTCVVRAFSALSFPEPGQMVRVTYPFVLSRAD